MKQVYYLEIMTQNNLKSKRIEFKNLYNLYCYIKKIDKIGYQYLITKKY